MNPNEIVRCVIHPGIGIARIGNSPTDYFICPEVPGRLPDPGGSYKDAQGRIKRQVLLIIGERGKVRCDRTAPFLNMPDPRPCALPGRAPAKVG